MKTSAIAVGLAFAFAVVGCGGGGSSGGTQPAVTSVPPALVPPALAASLPSGLTIQDANCSQSRAFVNKVVSPGRPTKVRVISVPPDAACLVRVKERRRPLKFLRFGHRWR